MRVTVPPAPRGLRWRAYTPVLLLLLLLLLHFRFELIHTQPLSRGSGFHFGVHSCLKPGPYSSSHFSLT